VGVIDLQSRKLIRNLEGLHEPQGAAYVPETDTVYVTNAGDGTVLLFHGTDMVSAGVLKLGDDADNIRVDNNAHHILVGYGTGALAIIDARDPTKRDTIKLSGHPEGFQVESSTHRIFVNIPSSHEIAVLDEVTHRQQSWSTKEMSGNYPMAIDSQAQRLIVAFRHPAALRMFDTSTGASMATASMCGDADDVFFDGKRARVYVSCGEGYLDVFSTKANTLSLIDHIKTPSGARTALFVPELDRLFLAVRATFNEAAAIWVYAPAELDVLK